MNLQPNSLLQGGKYKIEKVLGQGGFGVTYQAIQSGLNRKVAIKEFFMKDYCNRDEATSQISVGSEGSRDLIERFRNKFIKEAQMIADFKHPNIIRIIDIFEENGTAYYVMEYIGGGSLKGRAEGRGMSEKEAVGYVVQIAHALDYIHQKKITHLDVKPSNILVDDNQTAVLIDFGISKHYDDAGSQTTTSPVGRSKGFAPLEQYQQGGVTEFSACTDIYSLGATLYFLLTGKTPPEASEVYEDGLPELPAYISEGTRKAVEKAMQPRRKERPQSIGEFFSILSDKEEKVEPKAVVVEQPPKQEQEEEATVIDETPVSPFTEKLKQQQEERKQEQPMETVQPKVAKVEDNKDDKNTTNGVSGKKIFWGLVAVIVFIWLLVPKGKSAEELYSQGQEAYEKEDYAMALDLYHQAAEKGNVESLCELGILYFNGLGTKADTVKAVSYFREAANLGNAHAQFCMGLSYVYGYALSQDYQEAKKWYEKAAEQGHITAQYHLGILYENGYGVTQNYQEAIKWYKKAAEQEDASAQCNIGNMYLNGYGVTQDYQEAKKWYEKAAEQGNVYALGELGYMYFAGKGVVQNYQEAKKWYEKAAEQGNEYAYRMLGIMYDEGLGITQNRKIAKKWFEKAAEQGDEYAKEYLQNLIENQMSEQKRQEEYTTPKNNERRQQSSSTSNYQSSSNYSATENKDIVVWNPKIMSTDKNNKSLRITKVEINFARTIIDLEYDNYYGNAGWITIDPKTYIVSYNTGERYPLVLAEGIELSPKKRTLTSRTEKVRFRLIFTAMPKSTTQFNLIEPNSSWVFYGVKLK